MNAKLLSLLVFAAFFETAFQADPAPFDRQGAPAICLECKVFFIRADVAERLGWGRAPGEPGETKRSVLPAEEWAKTAKALEKAGQIAFLAQPTIIVQFGKVGSLETGSSPDHEGSNHPIETSLKLEFDPEIDADGIVSVNFTFTVKVSEAWQAYDAGKTAAEKSKPASHGWYESPLTFTMRTATIVSATFGQTLILGGFQAGKEFAPAWLTPEKEASPSDLIFIAITPKAPPPGHPSADPAKVSSEIPRGPLAEPVQFFPVGGEDASNETFLAAHSLQAKMDLMDFMDRMDGADEVAVKLLTRLVDP